MSLKYVETKEHLAEVQAAAILRWAKPAERVAWKDADIGQRFEAMIIAARTLGYAT